MAEKKRRGMWGNKGEWSELYVFMKLLSQGKIFAANDKTEKIADVYYPILNIHREEEKDNVIEYKIDEENVIVENNSKMIASIPRRKFNDKAELLLKKIMVGSGSFEIEEIEKFANEIKVKKIKAPSTDKTDISMEIVDINTGLERKVGFSIKSELGNSPTLLNAGNTTNFIYRVEGLEKSDIEEINSIDTKTKIKDRMAAMVEKNAHIEYIGMENSCFKRNLIMIDSNMPQIVGNMLLYSYSENINDLKSVIKLIGERDPLEYGEEAIYTYKVKKFLCSCALGMKPAKQWDGLDEANGGYIIVRSDGEVLAYHIYNRNFFEQYLLDNTVFERASTSRYGFMKLYEDNGNIYVKLNMQVRFK